MAEVGEIRRNSNLCLFKFAFFKERVVTSYEDNYIGHYCGSCVIVFRIRVDSLWKYNIGGKKHELRYFYDN